MDEHEHLADVISEVAGDQQDRLRAIIELTDDFCDTHPGQLRDCIHNTDCSVRVLWRSVEAAVRSVLESVSLADLTRNEASMAVWLDTPRHADGRGS